MIRQQNEDFQNARELHAATPSASAQVADQSVASIAEGDEEVSVAGGNELDVRPNDMTSSSNVNISSFAGPSYTGTSAEAQETIRVLQAQIIGMANDATRRHNELQNQLQGFEKFVEELKYQYEEFLDVMKLEHESLKAKHASEYELLKKEFDRFKGLQIDERRRLMREHQGLLYSMQAQFDEYRATAEFLFNTEAAKFEDKIGTMQQKYEQEIRYIVQAKDRFYEELLVAKDAKIMNLIEGSDLQSIMHKHELELERARKEHVKNIERVRSQLDSDQKRAMDQLQRELQGLEAKFEKAQSYGRSMEQKVKENLAVIEIKNQKIAEREAAHSRDKSEWERILAAANARIDALCQEREHLKHRIIRLQLDAKGEGDQSVGGMVKRLAHDTAGLASRYTEIIKAGEKATSEHAEIARKYREQGRLLESVRRELATRTTEFTRLTETFERFITSRATELQEGTTRSRPWATRTREPGESGAGGKMAATAALSSPEKRRADGAGRVSPGRTGGMGTARSESPGSTLNKKDTLPSLAAVSESTISEDDSLAGRRRRRTRSDGTDVPPDRKVRPASRTVSTEVAQEIERGLTYLKRFKTLSSAYATGRFHYPTGALGTYSQAELTAAADHPMLRRTGIYERLTHAESEHARYRHENPDKEKLTSVEGPRPRVYMGKASKQADSDEDEDGLSLKLYDYDGSVRREEEVRPIAGQRLPVGPPKAASAYLK
eukprot:Opistho-2@33396